MGLFRKGDDGAKQGKAEALASVVKVEALKEHKDGTDWRFITLVRPDGGTPFGALFEQRIPNSAGSPGDWHQIPVLYDPSKKMPGTTVTLDLSRLDSVDLFVKMQQTTIRIGDLIHKAPSWTLPSKCPNCGAAVDVAALSNVADPICGYCNTPLAGAPTG